MSKWNIQPSDVGGVLTAVAAHIGEEGGSEGLVGAMTAVEELVTEISTEANSAPVSVALGEFAQHNFDLMGDMASLTVSAVSGASEATTQYVNGNLDMAAEAQENAGVVPEPPTYGPNVPV
ncbi:MULTISPECIES: DUF6507 family protein [Nocardiopsis]|uniref:PE domain-containing protein n=1 Tax=Nocardiopsis sinuspersici TaxID=501010 RepID=A0A1V3C796_9ACTN|nr:MULTISPECIES: DUF6507 family protein [Nocardiopsis]OOC56647.1 hypothetical protein NOSIN_24770 [Nocardiopsis sinuspersici]